MKRIVFCLCLLLAGLPLLAMPLGTSARVVIPADIQQIISVDYRALKNSPTALALKARVLPDQVAGSEDAQAGEHHRRPQASSTALQGIYRHSLLRWHLLFRERVWTSPTSWRMSGTPFATQ